MYFKSIEDILNSDILSKSKNQGYSDRVLKSTSLERALFRELRETSSQIKQFENEGRENLSLIKELIADVFQAFYTITTGNNLSRALTSELSMLSSSKTLPVFVRKYQNKQLKQYRRREPISKGKGNIIVCLDESSSTYGDNQAWGMVVAMVLLHICHENKQNFALIHFSDEIKTDVFKAEDKCIRDRMLNESETFLGGSTDFEKPLDKAMELIKSNDFKDADIVFITDGICNISDKCIEYVKETQKKYKFGIVGVLLDEGSNMSFSLEKFAKKIYRTSELCKDDIVLDIMKNMR